MKEFVRTHVPFGLTKALDKDETNRSDDLILKYKLT